ncbi:zinc transporter ZntB [Oceanospirillum beijerinckii]|uniref:zinc transporter ZntB n=1 Tax=Oceanospirillum beijerinckii TaxID=64976 RepID=UPI0004288386|nr:zinc transporter ZntB [Oceanospirillum beijerinckii]
MTIENIQQDALIHCYHFDGKGKGELISSESEQNRRLASGFAWLHFDLNNSSTMDWLNQHSLVDPVIVEAMAAEETRPRCVISDKGILLILRGVNLNPGQSADDMISIRLWVEEHRVISVRRRKLTSVQDLRDQIQRNQAPKSAPELVVDLANHLTWHIGETIERYEEQLSDLEDKMLNEGDDNIRQDLLTIRRQLITLQRYLSPQKEAINRLMTEKIDWLENSQKKQLREVNDRLVRHLEDLAAMRERSVVVQQELSNHLAEKANTRVYLLSIITAIFLPLSFVTGLLGINVGGLPGMENPEAFWNVLWLLVISGIIQVIIMRWKHWL